MELKDNDVCIVIADKPLKQDHRHHGLELGSIVIVRKTRFADYPYCCQFEGNEFRKAEQILRKCELEKIGVF